MAVAVKTPTPVGSARPLNSLPVVSLLGVAYVVGSLGIVFSLIPLVWGQLLVHLGGNPGSYAAAFVLGVLMLGSTLGLCIMGGRLLGTDQPAGVRAGILIGFVGLLLALLLTRWCSLWAEYFADNNFFGASSISVGIIITLVAAVLSVTAALLYLFNFDLKQFDSPGRKADDKSLTHRVLIGCLSAAVAGVVGFLFVRYGPGFDAPIQKLFYQFLSVSLVVIAGLAALILYMSPASHRHMVELENQGWFTAKAYKPLQGVRVRRATIIGLLVLVAAGVYSMFNHTLLPAREWKLNVPFTGTVTLEGDGDVGPALDKEFPNRPKGPGLVIDRSTLQKINATADPSKYVKVNTSTVDTETKFSNGEVVPIEEYKTEISKLKREPLNADKKAEELLPTSAPALAYGVEKYRELTLLPNVKYTVGLLILPLLALWLAWRVINLPTFADFLIATEAEMNKVSWTTKKRLYQDTIVVLVTVLMMAVYLFTIDQIWAQLLSWKQIGVVVKPNANAADKNNEVKPW